MTEARFVIGVDVGTQSAKVMIFAATGDVVAEGHQALRPLEIPSPNRAVHPEDDLWDGVVAAFHTAVARFVAAGHAIADIEAMGICVIRCCRALCGLTAPWPIPSSTGWTNVSTTRCP